MRLACFVLAAFACFAACGTATKSPSPSPSAATSASPSPAASASASPVATPVHTAARRAAKTFSLSSSDNGKHLALVKGDKVELTLKENPSTGYSWEYLQKPNAAVLAERSSVATPPPAQSPPVVGAEQTHKWTYQATGAGSTGVKLRYTPPSGSGGDVFSFSVTVS